MERPPQPRETPRDWARELPTLGTRARLKVAVFRALKLGDLMVAVPALRAMRAALPNAEVVLVGLPWAREFVARFPHLLDRFVEFPGWPGLPERDPQLDRIPAFLSRMQSECFDLVLQLHGSGRIVNELCALFSGHYTAGFDTPGSYRPNDELFLPWPDEGLELRRLLALTEFLGFPTRGEQLEFPLESADWERTRQLIGSEPVSFVCVHPGASVPERRWPTERFAAIADALAACGKCIVLTGTATERELTQAVASQMVRPSIDLAGRTDLGTTAALIARARLLVCSDTGVSHVAAAVRTPSVVISTNDNPRRWAPTDCKGHRVLCRPGGWPDAAEVICHAHALIDLCLPFVHSANQSEGVPCAPSAC